MEPVTLSQKNDSIDIIQNHLFIKKTNKKLINLKWPGTLFHNQSFIQIYGNFFCEEDNIPLYINDSTPFELIPHGYVNLFFHFQYIKEQLFNSTLNHFHQISLSENKEAFGRIDFCMGTILDTIQMMMGGFDQLPEVDYDQFIDDWKMDLKDWNNIGIFSGSWDNFETFVNKRSLIIDEDLFLISNSSNDLNNILFHPFVNSQSISHFQNTFWPNGHYVESMTLQGHSLSPTPHFQKTNSKILET